MKDFAVELHDIVIQELRSVFTAEGLRFEKRDGDVEPYIEVFIPYDRNPGYGRKLGGALV